MKPIVVFNPHWRTVGELFSESAYQKFLDQFDVVWAKDEPITTTLLDKQWSSAFAYIAAEPKVTKQIIASAPNLKAVIEVSGAFPDTIDYLACAENRIEVLSCAPGFRKAVAEMGLAMAVSCARGLVTEHEAFRRSEEHWLNDNTETDFTMYGASVGFLGFGQIARELTRLLAPFDAKIKVYDPWLTDEELANYNVTKCGLDELFEYARCLFVTAAPTSENYGMVSRHLLSKMQDYSVLVLLSRAHLVDFDALTDEAKSGRLRVATDVFPSEPLANDHALRYASNVLLSPHRAAAVKGGRQLIGDLILHDLVAIHLGKTERMLGRADPDRINTVAGIGDAAQVADMAGSRTQ